MHTLETNIYTAIIIASFIVGIIIIYFALSLIKQQRLYLRSTTRNMLDQLSVLEKDRMRIAADLHDELFPLLTAAKWQVDAVEGAGDEERTSLATSKQYIDTVSSRLREIAKDLMPASLSSHGLQTALEEFLNIIQRTTSIKIIFVCNIPQAMNDDQKIHCYRIIQEITQNTLKHSAASRLLISLSQAGNSVKVICEDNGKGFNYDQLLHHSTGFGLKSIKNRADIISNNFTVLSVPGKGTQYSFDMLLK